MQALMADRYGPIGMLTARDVARPVIGAREVLVRVRAAGIHIGDVFMVKGSPFPVRLMTGLRRPRYGVPGLDLAGEVEAVGSAVTSLSVGDRVFGCGTGTVAEYARATESTLVPMSDTLGFVDAAALPTSGLAALHGLRDAGGVRAGHRVMINGASGGVGSFAVQIAKVLGGEVTAVTSTRNVEFVRSLGADRVIDYTRDDFTSGRDRYDVILDNVENRALAEVRRALCPGGTLVLNSGTGATGVRMLVRLARPLVISPFVGHRLRRYLSSANRDDLLQLRAWVDAGAIRPAVERTWSLAETPDALRLLESGRSRGKVVIAID